MFTRKASTPSVDDSQETIEVPTNQTSFINQEPLFEEPPAAPRMTSTEVVLPAKKGPPKMLLVVGGVLGLVVVVLLAALALRPRPVAPPEDTSSEVTEAGETNASGLKQRLLELEADLKEADPVQEELPLPPVNFAIYLDEPER